MPLHRHALLLLDPTVWAFILLSVGLVLILSRRARAGLGFAAAAWLALALGANPLIASQLLAKLEKSTSTTSTNHQLPAAAPAPDAIVVLGGGLTPATNYPLTSQLSSPSLVRLVEGLRLQHATGAELILSGGGYHGEGDSEAQAMADLARQLGATGPISCDHSSDDTASQALALRHILDGRSHYLVTSADHMPRAIAAFQAAGLSPLPAPADHRTGHVAPGPPPTPSLPSWRGFVPASTAAADIRRVLYESLAYPRTLRQVKTQAQPR